MASRFTLTGQNDNPLHVDFLPETRIRLSTPQGAAILCPDGALLLTILLERPDKFQGPRRLQVAVPSKRRRWWWPWLWYLPLPIQIAVRRYLWQD